MQFNLTEHAVHGIVPECLRQRAGHQRSKHHSSIKSHFCHAEDSRVSAVGTEDSRVFGLKLVGDDYHINMLAIKEQRK